MDLNTINNPYIGFSVSDNIQITDIISDLKFENKVYEIRKQDIQGNWNITEKANFFEWTFKIYNNKNENWVEQVKYLLSLNTGKKLYFKPYFDNVKTYDVYAYFELVPAQDYDYIECRIMRATKDSKLVGDITITVLKPTAETINIGDSYVIEWESHNIGTNETVSIELWKNDLFDSLIAQEVTNDGTYTWSTLGLTASSLYKIKIIYEADTNVYDFSSQFTLASPVTNWTPANTTTALWLDANDLATITKDGSNLVSQWNDKSGNGRNATASGTARPTWSSGKLTFDGTNNYMSGTMNSGTLSNGVTCIVLFKKTGANNTYESNPFSRCNGNTAAPFDYYNNTVVIGNGTLFSLLTMTDIRTITTQKIVITGSNKTNVTQFVNGTSAYNNTTNYYNDTVNDYYLATRPDFVTRLRGEVNEIIILPTNADTTLRQKIEGYLAWKWDTINGNTALVSALPSDHPYKSSAPTV